MSRSCKKNRGYSVTNAKKHAQAKRAMTPQTKAWINQEEDIPSGGYYKKFMHL